MKLGITLISTLVLFIHMRPISDMADVAAREVLLGPDHQQLRLQLVVDWGAAILALVTTTALSILKPRGLTGWGKRPEPATP